MYEESIDININIKNIFDKSNINNNNGLVYIFTTNFGYYISRVLKYLLIHHNINCEIVYDINYKLENLYIILFSQKVKVYPKNYIIYQLEQKDISSWIDTKYELSIYHSIITWDYSQSNIDKFHDVIKKKILYFPIPLVPYSLLNPLINLNNIPSNNILFYGSLNNIRKHKINYLQKKLMPKYFIKIVQNIYGQELVQEIINSKIVLNIHFYENAILETCRLNEILSCNRIVISEKPNMIDIKNYELYKNKVCFVENIDEMCKKIYSYFTLKY
jgi:hypothetical protein